MNARTHDLAGAQSTAEKPAGRHDHTRMTLQQVPLSTFVSTVEISRALKRTADSVRNDLRRLKRDGYVRQVSRGDASTPSLWVRTADGDRLLKETGAGHG